MGVGASLAGSSVIATNSGLGPVSSATLQYQFFSYQASVTNKDGSD